MFEPFMREPWAVVTLVALAAGMVGYFVALRGAGFAAHALPMAAFPGAAFAALTGVSAYAGLAGFAVLGALILAGLHRGARQDAATALVLGAMMALGALLLSLSGAYGNHVEGLLFGQVFAVGRRELWAALGMGAGVPLLLLALARPLTLSALAPELFGLGGGRRGLMDAVFLLILALTAALCLPVTGVLLAFSLMAGPGAAACLLARQPGVALGVSVALALGIGWGSMAAAYESGWPVGFFVGALAALAYVVARAFRRG
ncbi:metal ABC transporter permease [Acidocella sp.]|uniref:metal ABC transporter permease n=3 Tax=Acidocella sp. TaxID=50710 RepID=UPI00262A303A|nr:metal ABC transporter permease [Acidocella sp.]